MSTFWEVPLNVCLHFLCAFHLFPTMALYCHSASSAVQFAFLSPLVAPAWRELSMTGSCLGGSHGMPGTPPFLQDRSKFSSQHFKHEKDNFNQQANPCFWSQFLSFITSQDKKVTWWDVVADLFNLHFPLSEPAQLPNCYLYLNSSYSGWFLQPEKSEVQTVLSALGNKPRVSWVF